MAIIVIKVILTNSILMTWYKADSGEIFKQKLGALKC